MAGDEEGDPVIHERAVMRGSEGTAPLTCHNPHPMTAPHRGDAAGCNAAPQHLHPSSMAFRSWQPWGCGAFSQHDPEPRSREPLGRSLGRTWLPQVLPKPPTRSTGSGWFCWWVRHSCHLLSDISAQSHAFTLVVSACPPATAGSYP